ncbi:AMP-binding protein [Acinetobacter sp. M5A5_2a]
MNNLFNAIQYHAENYPLSEAIVTEKNVVNYAELYKLVLALKTELTALSIQKLGIYAENSIEWVLIDLAATLANITVIPIPLFFTQNQVEHLIEDSQINFIYTSEKQNLLINKFIKEAYQQIGEKLLEIDSKIISGEFIQLSNIPEKLNEIVPAKITYTSGSTGSPKGVCLAKDTISSITESLSNALRSSHLQRHLCLIPFATLLENIAGIYVALQMGRSIVVGEVNEWGLISNHEFDVKKFAETVAKYQIQSVILLPQMLKAIVEYVKKIGSTELASLKFIAVGGGKVAPDLLIQCQRFNLPVYEGYGLSECASVVSLNVPEARKIGSVGQPLPHVEVHINQQGEVVVRGNAMQGYLNDSTVDNLIHTGDAGFIDDDGYLFITGRIKQIIVSSFGRNISPEWVESNSLNEPEINQIAIFGEAQPYLAAVVYAKDFIHDDEIEQAIEKANTRLPDYAHIKHWCRSQQPFSLANNMLTDNGKLRRNEIKKQFNAFLFPDDYSFK